MTHGRCNVCGRGVPHKERRATVYDDSGGSVVQICGPCQDEIRHRAARFKPDVCVFCAEKKPNPGRARGLVLALSAPPADPQFHICDDCRKAVVFDNTGTVEVVAVDGGTHALPDVGERVRDRDADDGGEAIVLRVYPDTKASDHWIAGIESTVAAVNPGYDPDAPVVTVAFVEAVEREVDGWRDIDDLRIAAAEGAIKTYDYPAPRLEVVG